MLRLAKHARLFAAALALAALAPLAHAGALSDWAENNLIDVLFRGQSATINSKTLSWSAAPTYYVALATTAGSDAACGTEVTGGSYARVAVLASLTNWAGTQSAGSTTASTGTGGTTSNNNAITFPSPTANWGTVVEFCDFDAASGGNLIDRAPLTANKTINNGDAAPSFAAGAKTFQIDN